MQIVSDFILLNAQGANGSGQAVETKKGQDTIVILPVTAGATAGMTLTIEVLNPDGTNWHRVAQAAFTTVGAQTAIQLPNLFGQAIRATISAWASGTITVRGFLGSRSV
jgi:hypothetical protein